MHVETQKSARTHSGDLAEKFPVCAGIFCPIAAKPLAAPWLRAQVLSKAGVTFTAGRAGNQCPSSAGKRGWQGGSSSHGEGRGRETHRPEGTRALLTSSTQEQAAGVPERRLPLEASFLSPAQSPASCAHLLTRQPCIPSMEHRAGQFRSNKCHHEERERSVRPPEQMYRPQTPGHPAGPRFWFCFFTVSCKQGCGNGMLLHCRRRGNGRMCMGSLGPRSFLSEK